MVWYVPPLSPVMSLVEGEGSESDPDDVFPLIDQLRIPVKYLANLLTAGDEEPVRLALKRLAARRTHMREKTLGGVPAASLAASVGLTAAQIERLFRLLAVAKFDERYVIPQTHGELAERADRLQGDGGIDGSRARFTRRLL